MLKLEARSYRRYAFRMAVELERAGRAKARGLLIELSQDCARISQLSRGKYEEGDRVTILVGHDHKLSGTIRWACNGVASIRLTQPLPSLELHALVAQNRRQQEQAEAPELRYGT